MKKTELSTRMMKELAKIDKLGDIEWKTVYPEGGYVTSWFNEDGVEAPDYLHPEEGYNPLHRIINAMARKVKWKYLEALSKATTGILEGKSIAEIQMNNLGATVSQMADAILEAYGV